MESFYTIAPWHRLLVTGPRRRRHPRTRGVRPPAVRSLHLSSYIRWGTSSTCSHLHLSQVYVPCTYFTIKFVCLVSGCPGPVPWPCASCASSEHYRDCGRGCLSRSIRRRLLEDSAVPPTKDIMVLIIYGTRDRRQVHITI
jgi:hypothetical protein